MSISSIFAELDVIQEESKAPPATQLKGIQDATVATSAAASPQRYVSEASILLAEKQNARGKQPPQVTLLSSSRVAHSSSMDQIAVSDVIAPTYWKSGSSASSSKKKSKAVKAATASTKKLRLKYEKAENYTYRQHKKKQITKNKR